MLCICLALPCQMDVQILFLNCVKYVQAGAAAALLLSPCEALANEFDILNEPTPTKNYVIDDANVLNKTTKKSVNDELSRLEVIQLLQDAGSLVCKEGTVCLHACICWHCPNVSLGKICRVMSGLESQNYLCASRILLHTMACKDPPHNFPSCYRCQAGLLLTLLILCCRQRLVTGLRQ